MKEDQRMVAPLLLHRTSSATIIQKTKNAKGRELVGTDEEEGVWGNTDSEMQKSVKERKISPFISPRKFKSRSLDYVQYESTARGSEARMMVAIKSLFKNSNQRTRSRGNEASHTLIMRDVMP